MCVGLVTSYRSVHSLSSVEYIVSDPSDSAASVKEISVLHREEPSSSKEQVEFPNGTSVFISGKLTRFKGSVAIQASCMRKVSW
ncbi:hypothetical protein OESDEN_23864 [Oesophagostomum dentatum]|uniref:Uncharacterized protein n=1 Tax=Oesophagostomum dentatum TaxID=61180 RepID=A0A0B1RY05_OESDE|nr:hypothetical protein OESDEN_23864 [Oesophagostomum dentatum]